MAYEDTDTVLTLLYVTINYSHYLIKRDCGVLCFCVKIKKINPEANTEVKPQHFSAVG